MMMKRFYLIMLLAFATIHAWAQSTSDIGKVLAADGKMYKTVAAATNAGTTASGIIAYWGTAGSVESGNSSYRGMAIAIEDAVLRWGEWPDHTNYCSSSSHQCSTATSQCNTVSAALSAINGIAATTSAKANNGSDHWHNAPCNGYNVIRPSGASDWAIPSVGQWKLMAQGLTGKSSSLSDTDNPDYTYYMLSARITAAGGNTLQWLLYWSSTEKDASKAWTFDLGGINSDRNGSRFNAIAKNHDNQFMHVRMFFAFSSAEAAVYTISYNANGGSGAPSSQTKDGGIDLTLSSTVPTRTGYAFAGWNTKADGSGTNYASGAAFTGNANATLYAQWTFQGSGTVGDPYLIPSADVWNFLADKVSAGNTYSGYYFQQTADFTITRMMGTAINADGGNQEEQFKTFNGTYDGNGHTLTANLNVTGERYAGPFHCIADGATIKNLIVTGSVTVSGGSKVEATRHPAGLVGTTRSGSCVIENCRVSANVSGADYMGGLLGHSWHANITISGCVYSGTLTANGTNYTGGLIGWGGDDGGKTIVLTNNLFSGSYSGTGSSKFHPVGVLCSLANTRTVTNAYYTAGLVNMTNNDGNSLVNGLSDQGTFATPTSDKPANLGTPIAVYSVSGITVYTNGLCQAGQYICSSPEYDYSLSVASAIIMGESKYVTTFYHGTLDYELPAGALAYTAGKDGDKVVFYRIGTNSNVIPKKTAVIIVADTEGPITLTKLSSTDVTAKAGNILQGSDTDVTPAGTVYVLGVIGDELGFYPFSGSTIPAGKAYY
jgi:uncharacterized repeat protein (TIGR02543 family)